MNLNERSIALQTLLKEEGATSEELKGNIEAMDEDQDRFDTPFGEYLVCTDDEASEKAKEDIRESVWAFNKSFLDKHSKAIKAMPEKAFSCLQEECESANDAILAMIDDFDTFAMDAIDTDGRGHFLSPYDGEEKEQEVNGKTAFIYRL